MESDINDDSGNASKKKTSKKKKSVRLPKKKTTKKKAKKKKAKTVKSSVNSSPVKQEKNRKGNGRGTSPNSAKTQFKPGQSGNPKGRPRLKQSLTYWYCLDLEELASTTKFFTKLALAVELDPETTPIGHVLARQHLHKVAGSKSSSFMDKLQDRVEGKVPDQNDDSTAEEKAAEIREVLAQIDEFGAPPPPPGDGE